MSLFPDEILVSVIMKIEELIPGFAVSTPIGVFSGPTEALESFMARNYNDPKKYHTVKVPHFCDQISVADKCVFIKEKSDD